MSAANPQALWHQLLVDLRAEWPAAPSNLTAARDLGGLLSMLRQETDLDRPRIAVEIQAIARVFNRRLRGDSVELDPAA
jgi:hypothetical protein